MSQSNRIPFLDLVAPHQELKEELCGIFESALETGGFVGGPMLEQFEHDFARYCGSLYCAGVSSGTDALRFAIMAAGVPQGSIVITVPNTFIATVEAISQAGAYPAFVDVDDRTFNMDPRNLRDYLEGECYVDERDGRLIHRALGRPVSAIVPVHLYGQMADMDAILDIGERYNLVVIEDACQAHGAEYFSKKENRWRRAGSMGRIAAFSFYPCKNLGACGEGGAVTTNDGVMDRHIRMLRDHGQAQKYFHDMEGYNGRLDAIQAGILRVKLGRLADWNEDRRACAHRYRELLADIAHEIRLPDEPSWAKPVYHLFVVRSNDREKLRQQLAEAGIGTGIHYPIPLHLQTAYTGLGYKEGDFPVAEQAAPKLLSLPMFPGLDAGQQLEIAGQLKRFVATERLRPACA